MDCGEMQELWPKTTWGTSKDVAQCGQEELGVRGLRSRGRRNQQSGVGEGFLGLVE